MIKIYYVRKKIYTIKERKKKRRGRVRKERDVLGWSQGGLEGGSRGWICVKFLKNKYSIGLTPKKKYL